MFINRPAMKKEMTVRNYNSIVSVKSLKNLETEFYSIRDAIQRRLLAVNNSDLNVENVSLLRKMIEDNFNQVVIEQNVLFNMDTRSQLLEAVIADIAGYGPLEPLLADSDVTEIMVNGYDNIYVERYGLIEYTSVKFENDAHLRRIIDRIVSPLGRRVDESSPMVDARLPNGSRVNATIPPLSLNGPIVTIRKFAVKPYTAQDLIANETMSVQLANLLKGCVESRINMVISGGTGTGKTTLLNVISSFIPSNERIITIEDIAELLLNQTHVVRLEKRPPNIEGKGEVSIRHLVINALRMRPDRIVVGECRAGEALDMLQAMNTVHDGSMTTIHANTPRDALRRIEIMVLMAGFELPSKAIREQIASSIELIVHLERMKDGTRKVTQVTEVQGMEGDTIVLQDIFMYNQTGMSNGRVVGSLKSTGLRPKFIKKLISNNVSLADSIFEAS